jgi:23S rRNA pseudouridine1911/1915/1917 synthase
LKIVYQDEDVAVIDKPQGMVVHPAPGNPAGTLTNALMYHLDNLSAINGTVRPGIVHRIDKDTSGLLVVAKNDTAHNALAAQFKDHTLTRAYKAVVHGVMEHARGIVDAPIGRCPSTGK